jgi:hypothetical protein
MIETPVPAGEPYSVPGEGTGIRIVVHDEHLANVLVAVDA